jgi:hypothetical protein
LKMLHCTSASNILPFLFTPAWTSQDDSGVEK